MAGIAVTRPLLPPEPTAGLPFPISLCRGRPHGLLSPMEVDGRDVGHFWTEAA